MKLKVVFGVTSLLVPCKPEQTVSQVGADAIQRVAKTLQKPVAAFQLRRWEDLDGTVLDGGDAIGDLLKDGDTLVANYTENPAAISVELGASLKPASSQGTDSSGYSVASLRISNPPEPSSPAAPEPAADPNLCPGCNLPIEEGTVTKALNRRWHAKCFVCSECKAGIGAKFNVQDGKPYCKTCFEKLHATRCSKCGQAITESVVEALGGQSFHPECFRCGHCEKPIEGGFVEKGEAAFCEECFDKYHLPECAACGKAIDGPVLDFADSMYHEACFKCSQCGGELPEKFCSKEDKPLCDGCAGVKDAGPGAPPLPGIQQQDKLLVRFFV